MNADKHQRTVTLTKLDRVLPMVAARGTFPVTPCGVRNDYAYRRLVASLQ